jgi:hypothetical protein
VDWGWIHNEIWAGPDTNGTETMFCFAARLARGPKLATPTFRNATAIILGYRCVLHLRGGISSKELSPSL